MRDDILNVLSNSDKAIDIYELQEKLDIHDASELTKLNEELRKLEEEVIIYCSNKNKYLLLKKRYNES